MTARNVSAAGDAFNGGLAWALAGGMIGWGARPSDMGRLAAARRPETGAYSAAGTAGLVWWAGFLSRKTNGMARRQRNISRR